MVDSLTFREQELNIAFARIPNGTGDFVLQEAIHGFNNEVIISPKEFNEKLGVNIYPVPTSDHLEINNQNASLSNYRINVYSITGKSLHQHQQKTNSYSLDING